MNWQPIETAPKDGRPVLLAWADNSGDHPEIYRWSEDFGLWLNEYADEVWHPPSHWMPMPEPPASGTLLREDAPQSAAEGEA